MSLPDKYRHFIAAWESVPTENQTVGELMARLLIEEERNISSNETKSEIECVALATTTKTLNEVKCFGCGKMGHYKKDCRAKLQCFYCKKYGHSIKICRLRLNKEKSRDVYKGTESNRKSNAFTTIIKNEEANQGWLVDTGASEHMCFQRSLFSDFKEYESHQSVIVGDGRALQVIGKGKVMLKAFDGEEWIDTTLHNVLYVPKLTVGFLIVQANSRSEIESK